MRYISVCSGIEAASVAWHPFGWEAVAYSEVEPFPCSVLAHHYPQTPNWGDMTKWENWPDATVDVLVGGTPCQSYSMAGKRAGMDDPRGRLALSFSAIAGKYKPRWIVWENVLGVLSSGQGRDFGSFLGSLAELGYGVCYRVLDAQWFGLAQRRRRVFAVGYLGDWRRSAAVLFEPPSMLGDSPPRREEVKGTAGNAAPSVAGSLDTQCGGGKLTHQSVANGHVIGTLTARMFNALGARDVEEGALLPVVQLVGGERPRKAIGFKSGAGIEFPSKNEQGHVSPTLQALHKMAIAIRDEGSGDLSVVDFGAGKGFANVTINGPSPTLTTAGPYVVQTAMQVRRLTPRECERLQGFPDDYTQVPHRGKPAADGPRYKALGNSMAVPCMAWIGRRIEMVSKMED